MIGYKYLRKAQFGKTIKKKDLTCTSINYEYGTFYDNGNTCYIEFMGSVEDIWEQDLISSNLSKAFEKYMNEEITQEQAAVEFEWITGIKIGTLRKRIQN